MSNGIKVIIDNLIVQLIKRNYNSRMIMSLDDAGPYDIVIPYGIKESIQLSNTDRPLDISLLVDAVSLGYLNKIKFYLKMGLVFRYDFYYSLYAYLKWRRYEIKMPSLYKHIMMVSETDINYLKKISSDTKCDFFCIRNGANFEDIKPKEESSNFRIGLLGDWSLKLVYQESDWFVFNFFRKYIKDHPDTFLYIAGRGSFAYNFKGEHNVIVMGEIDSLDDFFSKIDVFVAVNPKGCGILNRVLDSYAHKTCVMGLPAVFSGFPGAEKFSFQFNNYKEFVKTMDFIRNHPDILIINGHQGYNYVQNKFNWEMNYSELADRIIELYTLKN